MDTLGCIHAWLTWEEQPEVPEIQIDLTPGFVTLILVLTCLMDLHPAIAAEILKRGSRGDEVGTLQYRLRELEYKIQQDGIFGSETYQAVIDFQKDQGLKVDGIVGKQTRSALWAKTCVMKKGCRGERVRLLQKRLNNLGFSVGEVDGKFGQKTYEAVISFQGNYCLGTDGVVDEKMTEILWMPRTKATDGVVNGETTKLLQELSNKFSIYCLEHNYQIPSLEKFNMLKKALQSINLEKKYSAAVLLSFYYIQQTEMGSGGRGDCMEHLNCKINEDIVVHLTNPNNKSKLAQLQE